METPEPAAATETGQPEGVPYLAFMLGRELFGVPLSRLREVTRVSRLRRLSGAASHIAGLVNVRGEILFALDVRAMLGMEPSPSSREQFLIALRDVGYPVGLVVDSVADVLQIDQATVAAPPGRWPPTRAACFDGLATVRLGQIGLLNVDRIVNG